MITSWPLCPQCGAPSIVLAHFRVTQAEIVTATRLFNKRNAALPHTIRPFLYRTARPEMDRNSTQTGAASGDLRCGHSQAVSPPSTNARQTNLLVRSLESLRRRLGAHVLPRR